MRMDVQTRRRILQGLGSLALAAYAVGVAQDLQIRYQPVIEAGTLVPRSLVVIIAFCLGVAAVALAALWKPEWLAPLLGLRRRLGWTRWVLAGLAGLLVSWFFLYTKWSEVLGGPYVRGLVLLSILGLMAWLGAGASRQAFTWGALLAAGVLFGSIFAFAYNFQSVLSFPFSLTWSEGNRIWDYSILYGRRLYLVSPTKEFHAYIDPGRQSLWGIPFLLPQVSIRFVRLWSALVFTVPYVILGWFAFWRSEKNLAVWFLLGLWAFALLNQGPIYTPLVLAAVLVAAARRCPLWLAFPLVLLAGYYAQASRITWMVAPAIWAVLLTMVEVSPYGVHTTAQRWIRAIALGIAGLAGGYLIPTVLPVFQAYLSGVESEAGVISVSGLTTQVNRQPLLWERLWPNPTYGPGIVLGLLQAIGPLALLLVYFGIRTRWQLNLWQKLVLWAALLSTLAVGLVVSVKIGGGGNLHNMDMFLISMLFATALAWEAGLRQWVLSASWRSWPVALLVLGAAFVPASQGMMSARPVTYPSQARADEAIAAIQQAVDEALSQGEVLFMDQRQLLTFGYIKDVPLVPEYEKKLMMDQAMADNQAYFAPFYADLAAHRFRLILSEPLWIRYQGDTSQFGNENDAWVRWVSEPVLCYYEPVTTYLDLGTQLLVPRQEPLDDPEVNCPKPAAP